MDMANTQRADLAAALVTMCRDCNNLEYDGTQSRLDGATRILKILDVQYKILWNGENDRYTAVELCGEVYTV